jgi:CBS domain-containing protein
MLVKKVMSSPAICVDWKTSIKETVEIMEKEDLGFLPVTKDNELCGVVTDRDILLRGRNHRSNSRIYKIATCDNLLVIDCNSNLDEAAKIMADNKIRRLVVTTSNEVCGVITSKDLLHDTSLIPYIKETYTLQAQ